MDEGSVPATALSPGELLGERVKAPDVHVSSIGTGIHGSDASKG